MTEVGRYFCRKPKTPQIMKNIFAAACFLMCSLLFVSGIYAQSNNGSAISGFVRQNDNTPIDAASIAAKNVLTGFIGHAITNKNGYFSMLNLPVGTYTIIISYVGFDSMELKNNVLNFGDRLALNNIVLKTSSGNELDEVQVTSNSFKNSIDRLGTSTGISSRSIQKIPTVSRNYTDLMYLSPLANGSSLAGAKGGGTGYMIDGVSNRRAHFSGTTDAAFSISSEVIREVQIATNSYDVTSGRGSGGVVKAITKSGTNTFSGSAWAYYGANALAAHKSVDGRDLNSKYKTYQFGALLSGPIVKDRAHFLIAYDEYQKTFPFGAYDFNTAGPTQEQAEKNLGITKPNLDKVVSIIENQFGFPKGPQYGTINITQKTRNVYGKLDWNINKKNLLTFSYNYLHFVDPNKLKGNGLLSTEYVGTEIDNAAILNLRSEISSTSVNELTIDFNTYRKFLNSLYPRAPEGFVYVTSVFADGTMSTNKQVAFGNQNWIPERDASDVIQLTDNFRFKVNNLNFVVGTDNLVNHITDRLTHDQQGQFYYASLDSMEQNLPYRFTRKVPLNGNPRVSVPIFELGVYAQMETNITPNLNLVAGLRWDGTLIGNKPAYNPTLDKDLGIRTDVAPFDGKNIQPRVSLTWDIHGNGQDILKWGAGLFASEFTTQAFTFAHIDNGVDYRTIDIYSGIPTPDWKAYQQDFNTVPGKNIYDTTKSVVPATVLALDKHLKNPLTFKTNISFYHYFNSWFRMGANIYFDNTWDNFYLYDKNLRKDAYFQTNEGRDVYAPETTLAASGTSAIPTIQNSRQSPDFLQVRYFTNATWSSKYLGVMIEANAQIGKDGYASLAYTKGKATGTLPYDNGDPRNANFSVAGSYWNYSSYGSGWYSDGDQPNKIIALLLSPAFYGFSVSASFQAYQANRFSAYIDKDIIGEANDGTDLAYIYNPDNPNTPSDIAEGMKTLLAKTSPQFKAYLEKYMGRFAAYNGGLMPWRTQMNVSINKDFTIYKTHKISLRCDIFNLLNLLNYKWGGYSQVINTTLYNVTGFDAATNSYKYSVNQNAGTLQKTANYYTVQFGIRYSF